MSSIVDFYLGKQKHPRGVTLEAIWTWSDFQLEAEHTYIQWLFPLDEESAAVPSSPVLTAEDIKAFRKSAELRDKVRKSLRMMLSFYGFAAEEGSADNLIITPAADFDSKSSRWLISGSHNFLRITRILKSLVLLGLENEAKEFFAALQRVYLKNTGTIGPGSYGYWKEAVGIGFGE